MRFVKLFEQFVEESYLQGSRAPLYHSTSIFFAASILQEDRLKGPRRNFGGFKSPDIISLTRDKHFIYNQNPVTFVIDQEKLKQDHKVRPVDFFGKLGTYNNKGEEAEEEVLSNVENLHKYLVAVRLNDSMDFYATYNRSSREMYREAYADFVKALDEYMAKHPHIKVIDEKENQVDVKALVSKIDWETLEVI